MNGIINMKNRSANNYKIKAFESRGQKYKDDNGTIRADTSANIYESMLTSPAYKDLKTRQQQLYTLCKAQYYGKRKPEKDNIETGLFQGNEYFYLNLASVIKYGLYTDNMRKEFYDDMKALEKHGFIKCESRGGGNGKAKSVYKYSADWHEWNR